MSEAALPAPTEHGWGKLLLALAAFLFLPHLLLRAVLPVEETLVLLLPALAACCLVGWWAGGRIGLAVIWVLLAVWIVAGAPLEGPYANMLRGWALLLAGAFGLISLLGVKHLFFSRALTAVSLALMLVLGLSVRGPFTPSRAQRAMQVEFARRNSESMTAFRTFAKQYPDAAKSVARSEERRVGK